MTRMIIENGRWICTVLMAMVITLFRSQIETSFIAVKDKHGCVNVNRPARFLRAAGFLDNRKAEKLAFFAS